MKTRRWLPVIALATIVGCGVTDPDSADSGGKADGANSEAKAGFFAAKNFYFVRINGWDPNKNSHDAIGEKTDAPPDAEVLIYRSNAASTSYCPDSEVKAADLVYRGKGFTIGTSGNLTDNTPKSSFKIKLADKLFGMKKINLKSMWNDVSQMRESLVWSSIFAKLGIVSSKHVYAKFCINDKYYGLYSLIENVDSAMFKDYFVDNSAGNSYKAYWFDIGPASLAYRRGADGDDSGRQYFTATDMAKRSYQLDSGSDAASAQTYDDLASFIRIINGVGLDGDGDAKFNTAAYRQSVESIFNVKAFLRWASANIILGAWDNYIRTPANYYLYNSGKHGATDVMAQPFFTWIPWDYDNSFGIDYSNIDWATHDIVAWENGNGGQALPLITNLLKNEEYLKYYLDSLEYVLTLVDPDKIAEQIGTDQGITKRTGLWAKVSYAAFLEADGPMAPPHTGRQFTNDQVYRAFADQEIDGAGKIPGIVTYLKRRVNDAQRQLATWRQMYPKGSSKAHFPVGLEPLP